MQTKETAGFKRRVAMYYVSSDRQLKRVGWGGSSRVSNTRVITPHCETSSMLQNITEHPGIVHSSLNDPGIRNWHQIQNLECQRSLWAMITTVAEELTLWETTDWTQLADDRVQCGSLINAETNFRVTYKMKVIFCCQVEKLLATQEAYSSREVTKSVITLTLLSSLSFSDIFVLLQPNNSLLSKFPSYSRNVRYKLRKNSTCLFFTFSFLGEFQCITWKL
jgi:hypothetical protein